jgi:hypothetical protein
MRTGMVQAILWKGQGFTQRESENHCVLLFLMFCHARHCGNDVQFDGKKSLESWCIA